MRKVPAVAIFAVAATRGSSRFCKAETGHPALRVAKATVAVVEPA